MRPKKTIAFFALFLAALLSAARPSHGQAQIVIGRLLLHGATWLVSAIASHQLGKEIDRATGEDFETKLKEAEARLVAEIRNGSPEESVLQTELATARSQLAMLETLMRGDPTQQQIERFRQELAADIERTRVILNDHGLRLEKLEGDIASALARLDSLERANSPSDWLTRERPEPTRPTLGNISWSRSGRAFSGGGQSRDPCSGHG